MALVLVTAPQGEPVSVDETKEFMRVTEDADEVLIASLITTARQHLDGREGWLGRALVTQTWDLFLDRFPSWYWRGLDSRWYDTESIFLPLSPVQSVTSITYLDTAGVSTLLSPSVYTLDNKNEPPRITLAYGQAWPSTRDVANAVTIRTVYGYGVATDVPEPIRTGIKALVAHWYENREPMAPFGVPDILPMHISALLANYRLFAYA